MTKRVPLFINVLIGLFFAWFAFFYIIKPVVVGERRFLEAEYFGVVDAIEIRPGHRNVPHVLLNGEWRLLTVPELKIASYIQLGDSVVKHAGDRTIVVFRSDVYGNVTRREFR